MSKVFRIEETEHRVYQHDIFADNLDDALEQFPAKKADASGYYVRVCDDHGSIKIEELPQEVSASVPVFSVREEQIHYDDAGRQAGSTVTYRQNEQ